MIRSTGNAQIDLIMRSYVPANERNWYPWKWPGNDWYKTAGKDEVNKFIERVRHLARTDLFFFADNIMRNPNDLPLCIGLHDEICHLLQCGGDIGILIPRNHLKSTIVSGAFPIWLLGKNPNLRIMICSAVKELSESLVRYLRDQIKANKRLRQVFPDLQPALHEMGYTKHQIWNKNAILVQRDVIRKEPSIMVMGLDNQPKTGYHCDLMIYDDIVTHENANSAENMRKAKDNYEHSTNLMDRDSRKVYAGTRYNDGDTYGDIMEKGEVPFYVRGAVEDGKYIWPAPSNVKYVEQKRLELSPYIFSCNPGYAPVWMADGTFKNIEDIQEGEYVVGIDIKEGERNKLVSSKVLKKGSRVANLVLITTESGRQIICTPDHQWLRHRFCREKNTYKIARVGELLAHVIDPVQSIKSDEKQKYAYLAGMIDGEGACKHGSISISQSEFHNPAVCRKIEETLNALNIPYKHFKQQRENKTLCSSYILAGGRQIKANIINHGKPAKASQIMGTIFKHGKRIIDFGDKVMRIEPMPIPDTVYSMQTETGNYVIWGYASKNCQYQNDPIIKGDAEFEGEWVQRWTYDLLRRWLNKPTATDEDIFWEWVKTLDLHLGGDPNRTDKKRSDYGVVMVVGADVKGQRFGIYMKREKMKTPDYVKAYIKAFTEWNPKTAYLETYGGDIHVYNDIRNQMKEKNLPYFRVKEYEKNMRMSGDDRIRKLQSPMQRRWWWFGPGPEWDELINQEMLRFPYAKHDDALTTMAYIEDQQIKKKAETVKEEVLEGWQARMGLQPAIADYDGRADAWLLQ